MKILISTIVITVIILTSCNQNTGSNNKVNNEHKEFNPNVEIMSKVVSETEIQTIVNTNFPDSTLLTLTATRGYKRKNSNENYSVQLYYSFNSIVKNGQIIFKFNPIDKSWINDYENLRKQNSQFDKALTEIDAKSIKDTIEISVTFTPKKEQPENVVSIVGKNGENLIGDGVETNNNGFKIFNNKIKFYNKF